MQRWLSGWKYIVLIIGLAVVSLMIMDMNGRVSEYRRLSQQRQQVSDHVTQLVQTQAMLQTEIAYATSPAGVLEWAYQDGHWVRKGDTLVVPISPAESTPLPTPTVAATAKPLSTWQLWLSLFIDPSSP